MKIFILAFFLVLLLTACSIAIPFEQSPSSMTLKRNITPDDSEALCFESPYESIVITDETILEEILETLSAWRIQKEVFSRTSFEVCGIAYQIIWDDETYLTLIGSTESKTFISYNNETYILKRGSFDFINEYFN